MHMEVPEAPGQYGMGVEFFLLQLQEDMQP